MKNIHIAMICDDNYILPTCVAIQSFVESMNDDIMYNIHIVMSSCSEDSYNKINRFNSEYIIIDIVHRNAELEFKNFHVFKEDAMCCASIAALFKFSLGDIFPDLNKILYLDGDLISKISLEEIYDIDITDYYGAAVLDSGTMYNTRYINNKTFENYFNSGVMLLNLKKIREDNKIFELIDTKKNLKDSSLMDQNVFNIVFEKK